MDGVLNLLKPAGMTSHDAVASVRRLFRTKKVGHTGTLDPLATGVMLVCVGKATKLASDLEAKDKVYIADFDIGYATDTYDIEGKKIAENTIEISKENLDKIWIRFFQADSSRTTDNSGLGLPMVKGIIEAHNGNISVTSELGKGTTFSIILPFLEKI